MAPPRAHRAPTVLVVDDSELFRCVAAELATAAGLEVVGAASDAETAVAMLASGADVDLVLMDVQLPLMSGIEAARVLTQLRPGLPVLLTSALDRADVADLLAADDAAAFVPKAELDVEVLRRHVRGGAGTPWA